MEPCLFQSRVFSFAATIDQVRWVRVAGFLVVVLTLLAPITFLVLVTILSIRLLMGRSMPSSTSPAPR
jgi:hypothetical protein